MNLKGKAGGHPWCLHPAYLAPLAAKLLDNISREYKLAVIFSSLFYTKKGGLKL
jgi:hypothetical protein